MNGFTWTSGAGKKSTAGQRVAGYGPSSGGRTLSSTGQTTENQIQEIETAGFQVEPRRIITETVSGSTAIVQRRGISKLMDRLESGATWLWE